MSIDVDSSVLFFYFLKALLIIVMVSDLTVNIFHSNSFVLLVVNRIIILSNSN